MTSTCCAASGTYCMARGIPSAACSGSYASRESNLSRRSGSRARRSPPMDPPRKATSPTRRPRPVRRSPTRPTAVAGCSACCRRCWARRRARRPPSIRRRVCRRCRAPCRRRASHRSPPRRPFSRARTRVAWRPRCASSANAASCSTQRLRRAPRPDSEALCANGEFAAGKQERTMTISVVPLSGALGAEIKGVDLRAPQDAAAVAAIRDAFDRNVVVVFGDQQLSEDDQLRVAGYFGKVAARRRPASGRDPGGQWDTPFMLVTNIVEDGKPIGVFGDGEMWFHHDTSYYPEPHRATFLYAMKLPSTGGNTCFSNMYKAYENVPRALRDRLEGRKVLQVHDYKRRERLDLDTIDFNR